MGKIVTVQVPVFTGGMTNDPRNTAQGVSRRITNFDITTDPRRAIPYYDSEDGDSGASTSQKQNFCIANWLPGSTNDWRLFGLGVVSGSGKAEVNMKILTTGGATDLDDNGWASPANNASSAGSTNFELFVYYKKTGLIYGARAGTNIWAFDPTTAGAWADTSHALVYTKIAQGLVHSQDDILYVPYDNKIATNDNGSWNDTALTLPSEFYITSISEYGPSLAIACAPLSGVGRSRVYIWDRSSTLTNVTANIDWGEGVIKVLEELEGYLVGISIATDSTRTKYRVTFRSYAGASGAIPFNEFTSGSAPILYIAKQKINRRILFLMTISLNGTQLDGVWSISRPNGTFAIAHERTPNNDTAISSGPLKGFFAVGDYLFISYVNALGSYALSKTNDQASYTATSIIESAINPNMPPEDRFEKKKLMSVGASYDALPAAGQVVAKAKVDGSSNTTIFTETTDNAVYTEPVPVPSGGTYLSDGKELEFRLESTGGAVISGYTYKYEIIPTNL